MKKLFALLLSAMLPVAAFAQSNPGFVFGSVPSAAQWNGYFSSKMDYAVGGIPVASGGTGATTAAGARTNLGIGTSAIYPIGISGVAIPLLSTANTWSGHQTIEGVTATGATGTGKMVYDNSPVLVTPNIGAAIGVSLDLSAGYALNGSILFSTAAPTLASGGCTSPSAVTANGTAAFSVSVGTGCSGSQPLVFTLAAAPNSWSCGSRDISTDADVPQQTGAVSTTSVTITNYVHTTGVAVAWTDNDVIEVRCTPY